MSRFGRAIVRGLAWAIVPIFIVGIGSKIWLQYQLGLPACLNDIMILVGFGAFALVGSLLQRYLSTFEGQVVWNASNSSGSYTRQRSSLHL